MIDLYPKIGYGIQVENISINKFLIAQNTTISRVLEQLKDVKKSHWVWWVFPQIEGLIKNPSITTVTYLKHDYLFDNYMSCCEALLNNDKTIYEILGEDVEKVRSSLTLFGLVTYDNKLKMIIDELIKFKFNGITDDKTIKVLDEMSNCVSCEI